MTDKEFDEFMIKCANIPYKDYSWLKDHCYRTLSRPCSPNARNEHLAILDLIKEHEERQWILVSERMPENGQYVLFCDIDDDIMIGYHVKGRPDTHFSQDGTFDDMKNVLAWMLLPEPYKPD